MPVEGRRLVLGNNDVRIAYVVTDTDPSPLYRNAIGDECVYVEVGTGIVESVFGVVPYRTGDYVVIPRATTHRWVPTRGQPALRDRGEQPHPPAEALPVPLRAVPRARALLRARPARTDRRPAREGDNVDVLVKHRTSTGIVGTRMTYATHPFDVVGWDGCLYPYTFNIDDFMPITGKVHQPPPVHQVFEGWNFVICNFLPRKVDYHELAIPVPYYHSNVDSDEVMFYVGGDYEARKGSGINLGSISLHPGGYAHGPQPAAIEASLGADYFEESAVMVDTFAPLDLGEGGLAVEDPAYAWTWAGRGPDDPGGVQQLLIRRRRSPATDRCTPPARPPRPRLPRDGLRVRVGSRPRLTRVVRPVSLRFHQPTSHRSLTTIPPPASAKDCERSPHGWPAVRGKLLPG